MWEFSWRQDVFGDISKDAHDFKLSQVVKCWADSGKLQNWTDGQQVADVLHHRQMWGNTYFRERVYTMLT